MGKERHEELNRSNGRKKRGEERRGEERVKREDEGVKKVRRGKKRRR